MNSSRIDSSASVAIEDYAKQWGAWGADGQKRSKKANGRTYRGKIYDSMPDVVPAIA
jgi:protein gp37